MKSLALVAVLFWACSVVGADLYHYVLPQYPRGASCESTAAEIASRFSQATSTDVYWAGSLAETPSTCEIKITYVAEAELPLVRNQDVSGLGAISRGTARTRAECEADLSRERTVFETSTGVAPWLSYCYSESTLLNAYPFVPVVHGFGSPGLQFFSSSDIFAVTPASGWAGLLPVIWKTAQTQGVAIASLVVRPYISASDREITARYYAKERFYLRHERVAEYRQPATCEAQVETVRTDLAAAKHPPLAVYCGEYSAKRYTLALVGLSTNLFGVGNLRAWEDPKAYVSLAECRRAVPETLTFYREKLEKNVLSAFCADSSGHFRTTVFEERPPIVKPQSR